MDFKSIVTKSIFTFGLIVCFQSHAQFASPVENGNEFIVASCADAKVISNRSTGRYSIEYTKDGVTQKADDCQMDRVQRGMSPEEIVFCLNVSNGDELVYKSNSIGLRTLTLIGSQTISCK